MNPFNKVRAWIVGVALVVTAAPFFAEAHAAGATLRCSAENVTCTPEETMADLVSTVAVRDGISEQEAHDRLARLFTPPTPVAAAVTAVPQAAPGRYTHPVEAVERWHDLALKVGWAEADWKWLACVINRESGGNPDAKNGKDPGHGSFGLTQLNMTRSSIAWFRERGAFWEPSELFNPEINLNAARIMRIELGKGPWKSKRKSC